MVHAPVQPSTAKPALPRPAPRLPRRPGTVTGPLVGAAALALVAGVAAGWGRPSPFAVPALALLAALAELVAAGVPRRAALTGRDRWGPAGSEAAVAAALVLSPGGWVPAAAVAGAVLARLGLARLPGRPPLRRVLLPLARLAAGSACAAAVSVAANRLSFIGPVLAAALGMAVWWAVAHVLTVLSVARTTGRSARRLLANRAPQTLTVSATSAAIGVTSGWLAGSAPAGLLGLLAPLGLLAGAARQSARQSTEAALFAEIARSRVAAGQRSIDESAGIAVTAAARLLGGADVELVLLAEEGAVRYAGAEHGPAVRAVVDPDAFDEPWLLRALGSGTHGARSGVEHNRPVLTALVGSIDGTGAPMAALVARRPAGATPFGRREIGLVEALATHTASWLAGADGVGATAVPATPGLPSLGVLRSSALRLAALAAGAGAGPGAGPVADPVPGIVDELQVLERAVAAAIGALASDQLGRAPDAGEVVVPHSAQRVEQAPADPANGWTSTGVMP